MSLCYSFPIYFQETFHDSIKYVKRSVETAHETLNHANILLHWRAGLHFAQDNDRLSDDLCVV